MDDLEAPGAMVAAAAAVATATRDVVLLFTAGDPTSLDLCANALLQMRALGLEKHALVVAERHDHCERLASRKVRAACGWSSRILEHPPSDSFALRRFWDNRFRFYHAKKYWLAELVRNGFGVLQADTDTVWNADPLPTLRSINASVVVQNDAPFANAGVVYARPGGARAQRMLDKLAWSIQLMQNRPSAIARIVPFATPPFYGNMDDQTGLNDAIVVAVTQNESYALLGMVFKWEANNRLRHHPVHWSQRAESATWKQGMLETRQRSVALTVSEGRKCLAFRLEEGFDHIAIAPKFLFGHAHHKNSAVMHLQGLCRKKGGAFRKRDVAALNPHGTRVLYL